jgi:hypothetical protein
MVRSRRRDNVRRRRGSRSASTTEAERLDRQRAGRHRRGQSRQPPLDLLVVHNRSEELTRLVGEGSGGFALSSGDADGTSG